MDWYFLSFSSLILSSLHFLTSTGEDRIAAGQSIRTKQTITSSNDNFALGFFSPGNSTKSYVGIWYNKIPDQTVIWVANKENPLTNSTAGVLTITHDGNLVVLEGDKNILWSSNVSISVGNNTVAVLTDTGNLVLRQTDQTIIWQSFDNPSSSLLPGMRLSLNTQSGKNILLTSWKDVNDPATGSYALGIDPHTPWQLIIFSRLGVYMRAGVWQKVAIASQPEVNRIYVGYVSFVVTDYEISIWVTLSDNSFMVRYLLTPTGLFQLQSWQEDSKAWAILQSSPTNKCDLYSPCGPFASCDNSSSPLICKCLKGFEPRIRNDWDSRNWSGGCVRQKALECLSNDGFFKLTRMKLPDFSISAGNVSVRDCELGCFRNCSCTAYAYTNVSGWGSWECLIWMGDLIDIVENTEGAVDLYLRLAASELGKKNKTLLIVGIVIGAGALSFISISAIFIWRRRSRHIDEDKELLEMGTKPNTFSYSELRTATRDFSLENKLGMGGFGAVYKGTLSDGRIVAAKQLSVASHHGNRQFVTEIVTISVVQHRNLVKLCGCCIDGDKRLLVYEYLENGSLDHALFGDSKLHLNWPTRYRICMGTARGLTYLHEESSLRIVHRDIKASNILLDADLNPKISDFGLAKLYDDKKTHISTRVAGTIGYLAPEYALRGYLTEKADVFGFGVVALEILSGRPNKDTSLDQYKYLLEWAWTLHEANRSLELMDPTLSEFDNGEALRMIGVALLCTQTSPVLRPPMSRVVAMLSGDVEVSNVTSRPSYLTLWQFNDLTNSLSDYMSRGSMGITMEGQCDMSNNSSWSTPAERLPLPTQPLLQEIIGERQG